jgi:hypothetical protein
MSRGKFKVGGNALFFVGNGQSTADGASQKVVDQTMKAGLPAQVLQYTTGCFAWNQAPDAKLPVPFVNLKPVVGLLALNATDIAGNCLPDHLYSLQRS